MKKLDEIFVNSINKAITSADVMTDINQKPMAYAAIAKALAIYLGNNKSNNECNNVVEPVNVESAKTEPVNKEEEKGWQLSYDENGIPFLKDEEFADPAKVLAYENAMTPELRAKKEKIEAEKGAQVLSENNSTQAAPVAEQQVEQQPQDQQMEYKKEHLDALEQYKTSFNYLVDPSQLDKLYHNFTNGTHSTLADLTPGTIEPFIYFIKEQLSLAYQSLETWKNSWITKEGLDNLIAQAYGVEGATIETYIQDGNIFWFLEYVSQYNANAWFNTYKTNLKEDELRSYVQKYLEDSNATIDDINDQNVVGFIYFIQQTTAEIA